MRRLKLKSGLDQTAGSHSAEMSSNNWTQTLIVFVIIYKHRANKHKIPETKNIEEGSARRNIARKHDYDPKKKEKKQQGGAGGKGKWNKLDDGSLL